jgi:hypothetical protein
MTETTVGKEREACLVKSALATLNLLIVSELWMNSNIFFRRIGVFLPIGLLIL